MWIDFNHYNYKIDDQSLENSCTLSHSIRSFLNDWYDQKKNTITVLTSGTTKGNPKVCFLKKKHMYQRACLSAQLLKINKRGVKGLLCLPIHTIAAKMFLLRSVIFKWIIFCDHPSSRPLKNIKNFFDISSMTPMQVEYSIKKLYYIKVLLIGGSKVSNSLERKLQHVSTHCYATYGMTETSGHIALKRVNGNYRNDFYKSFNDVTLYVNKYNCLRIRFMDLFVKTNDIVSIKSYNEFSFIGRYDNVINSGGIKIIPELIEKLLSPFIMNRRFFISSIPDKILGEKIILVIEGPPFLFSIPKEIFFGKMKYLKPRKIFFLKRFLEDLLGKIKKKEMKDSLFKNL
ncbi:AMP-binding protein [Blattabacterium cuenoti]|uniref:AMP-binding protein n=1 Tax=Blattabacterium cuenoti TaxID=1653831 RepID=UPI00163CAE0A|nr:AMP-binding protein [Blattabacterium cuenoti]